MKIDDDQPRHTATSESTSQSRALPSRAGGAMSKRIAKPSTKVIARLTPLPTKGPVANHIKVSYLGCQVNANANVIPMPQIEGRNSKAKEMVDQLAPTGLLTAAQAGSYLGISPSTLAVWRSTNRRVLAYVKIGSSVRYRREDLDKFIAANLCNA